MHPLYQDIHEFSREWNHQSINSLMSTTAACFLHSIAQRTDAASLAYIVLGMAVLTAFSDYIDRALSRLRHWSVYSH